MTKLDLIKNLYTCYIQGDVEAFIKNLKTIGLGTKATRFAKDNFKLCKNRYETEKIVNQLFSDNPKLKPLL